MQIAALTPAQLEKVEWVPLVYTTAKSFIQGIDI